MGDTQSDSQETNSTSVIEDSLNIVFKDITYTVRNGIFVRGRKHILSGISGSFIGGELAVIVGQSGAGKSSLLDILSGYTKPSSGRILVNERPRNEKMFRRRSCYILQDDKIQDQLTVKESLQIAAELKLGNHISTELKNQRVHEIITSLDLSGSSGTIAHNLSGGQKKRLAIGLELVTDPTVMFLDEPTSGLDSSIAKQLIYLLHVLARQGRTVVITMHQPSATLLEMVDRLYAVASGKCAYIGSVPRLVPYLREIDLICPSYHNPVDFLIELCVEQEHVVSLIQYSQNGQNISNISDETDNEIKEKSNFSIMDENNLALTMLPPPKEDPTSKILLKLKSTYSTTPWKQFTTLTWRSLLSIWRNPFSTLMITGIHCFMALFIGVLYYNIGEKGQFAHDNYRFLNISLMFLMFTAYSAISITFPDQMPVIRREHFNRWYTTGAYYSATLVSALPTQTVCTLSYALIAYYMTGQPWELERFLGFCWILLLVTYVALCMGLLNGSMFSVKNAVIFGPFIIMPFVVFSGIFLSLQDAPKLFHWMFHISFLKHGLVGVALSIYGMGREKLPCSEEFCYYKYPKLILELAGAFGESFGIVVLVLFGIMGIIILCTYIILKIRLKNKW